MKLEPDNGYISCRLIHSFSNVNVNVAPHGSYLRRYVGTLSPAHSIVINQPSPLAVTRNNSFRVSSHTQRLGSTTHISALSTISHRRRTISNCFLMGQARMLLVVLMIPSSASRSSGPVKYSPYNVMAITALTRAG